MQVILLERIDNLGHLGEVVKVRTGYARNYLLPQKKALRATKDNMAYFETQRAALEKLNNEKKKEAEKLAKKVEGLKVVVIRHASEGGHLFGSVNARDVAEAVTEESGVTVSRNQVQTNLALKTLGLFPVSIALHPEVKVTVTVNIARSAEEAKIQAKTGKAVIAEGAQGAAAANDDAKAAFLEEGALKAEQEEGAEEAAASAADAEKAAKKSKVRKEKKESKKADEAEGEEG
jgi:large subunit ribosomal protein L9